MKYFIFIITLLSFLLFLNCSNSTKKSTDIKICLNANNSGWFYIFITNKNNNSYNGDCLIFDKNNTLIIEKNWILDSTKMNLFKNNILYNDSAYFFSKGEYQSSNSRLSVTGYSFFINDTLTEEKILVDEFSSNEHFRLMKKIDQIIKEYHLE